MRIETFSEPLYAIADRYREILSIDMDDPDAKAALKAALDEVQEQFDLKAESIIRYIRNLEAQGDAIRAEEKHLADRRKAVENKAASLKDYIAESMRGLNLPSVKAGIFEAKFQKNPAALSIIDASKIPARFFIPQEPRLDNASLKDALKAGEAVDGAELVQGESLRIR